MVKVCGKIREQALDPEHVNGLSRIVAFNEASLGVQNLLNQMESDG